LKYGYIVLDSAAIPNHYALPNHYILTQYAIHSNPCGRLHVDIVPDLGACTYQCKFIDSCSGVGPDDVVGH
jgi:hypothetical protein